MIDEDALPPGRVGTPADDPSEDRQRLAKLLATNKQQASLISRLRSETCQQEAALRALRHRLRSINDNSSRADLADYIDSVIGE